MRGEVYVLWEALAMSKAFQIHIALYNIRVSLGDGENLGFRSLQREVVR